MAQLAGSGTAASTAIGWIVDELALRIALHQGAAQDGGDLGGGQRKAGRQRRVHQIAAIVRQHMTQPQVVGQFMSEQIAAEARMGRPAGVERHQVAGRVRAANDIAARIAAPAHLVDKEHIDDGRIKVDRQPGHLVPIGKAVDRGQAGIDDACLAVETNVYPVGSGKTGLREDRIQLGLVGRHIAVGGPAGGLHHSEQGGSSQTEA
ncbi:hypothetical protein PEC18_15370 [Paucibacter sp. O1-1]|nr:hypothetical protein [Paucibacter sp. O1-1]MDA3827192.1 hypothetical protein [Paucibacter sp. O1-1]